MDIEILIRKGTKATLGCFTTENHADGDILCVKELPCHWGYNESKANHLLHYRNLDNWLNSNYLVRVKGAPPNAIELINNCKHQITDNDNKPTHRTCHKFHKENLPDTSKQELDSDSITEITWAQLQPNLCHKITNQPV